MIYLSDFINTEDINIVKPCFVHYCPFDKLNGLNKTKEELEKDGILVDFIPEIKHKDGYFNELHYDKISKQLFYKEFEKEESINELTEEQKKIKELENKMKEQEQAILELTSMITGGNTNT